MCGIGKKFIERLVIIQCVIYSTNYFNSPREEPQYDGFISLCKGSKCVCRSSYSVFTNKFELSKRTFNPLEPSTQTFCRKSPPTNGLSTYGFYFPSKCTCLLKKKTYLFIYIEENYNRQKHKGFGLLRQT